MTRIIPALTLGFVISLCGIASANHPTGITGTCIPSTGNYSVVATWTNPVQTATFVQAPHTTISYLSPIGHDAPQSFSSGSCNSEAPPPKPSPAPTHSPIVIANTNANNNTNTNNNANLQNQNQNQNQNQHQSQNVMNAGNNVGTASAVNNSVYQAPITFIAPAGACDRATVGATVTNYQYGVGVNIPLGRRIGCESQKPDRIEQCIRYAQLGVTVDNVDCHDVHTTVVVPTPPAMPMTTTKVVRVDHYNVYREPATACVLDSTATQDLAYVHANRKANLNATHQTQMFSSAYNRLTKSCTPSERILRALDG